MQCVAKLHGSECERTEGSEEKEYDLEKDDGEKKGKEKQKVYAARAMKKAERQAEVRRKYEQWKTDRGERYTVSKKPYVLGCERKIAGNKHLRQESRTHS